MQNHSNTGIFGQIREYALMHSAAPIFGASFSTAVWKAGILAIQARPESSRAAMTNDRQEIWEKAMWQGCGAK